MTRHRATMSVLMAAFLAFGCKPKEGGTCSAGSSVCTGADSSLFCENGHFVRMNCRGPAGCAVNGSQINCDQIRAVVGDHCMGDGAACSLDGLTELKCIVGTMLPANTCRGAEHCHVLPGHNISCDRSVAALGDSCATEGSWACSEDHQSALDCHDAKFRLHAQCRGPLHCRVEGADVRCDESVALAGDPCAGEVAACSADGMTFLRCQSGAFAEVANCRGPQHCTTTANNVDCDESLGAVGDPCSSGGACSVDGTEWLHCEEGHLIRHARCTGGCVVANHQVSCTGPRR